MLVTLDEGRATITYHATDGGSALDPAGNADERLTKRAPPRLTFRDHSLSFARPGDSRIRTSKARTQ